MTLNPDQLAAADEVFQFLFSDEKFYKISGAGGTGKTHLMSHIMNELLPRYEKACALTGIDGVPYQISLTATTNKAAEVLQNLTGCPAETIHSFMNLTVKDNYSTGQSEIRRTSAWEVHKNKLLFIDEASMTDTHLLRHIEQGTDNTCKVIFVGDHCQLAPVFEDLSPVYLNTQTGFSELTQPMRNAGQPALMQLCRQLRHTVKTGEFYHMVEVPGVIDYLDGAQAEALIDTMFLTPSPDNRILAYSNQRVQEYNTHIRDIRGYGDLFRPGEQLINNNGFQLSGSILRPEEEVHVVSADHTMRSLVIGQSPVEHYTLDICRGTVANAYAATTVKIAKDHEHVAELLRYFARQKDWTSFFSLKNAFPDLRQRDASTVYKAQGSTFQNVFIDLANIGSCNQPKQVARMLYVAISRPTQRIFFYGGLPPKYEGIPAPQPF